MGRLLLVSTDIVRFMMCIYKSVKDRSIFTEWGVWGGGAVRFFGELYKKKYNHSTTCEKNLMCHPPNTKKKRWKT